MITPTADAQAYFDAVSAPIKRMIRLPDAGHFAFMTAPTAFLAALTSVVRPVAGRRSA